MKLEGFGVNIIMSHYSDVTQMSARAELLFLLTNNFNWLRSFPMPLFSCLNKENSVYSKTSSFSTSIKINYRLSNSGRQK